MTFRMYFPRLLVLTWIAILTYNSHANKGPLSHEGLQKVMSMGRRFPTFQAHAAIK